MAKDTDQYAQELLADALDCKGDDLRKALSYLDQAVMLRASKHIKAHIYYHRSEIYRALRRIKEAQTDYDEAVKLNPHLQRYMAG